MVSANGHSPPPATFASLVLYWRMILTDGTVPDILRDGRRVQSECSAGTMPGSHLALPARWRMAYCSCQCILLICNFALGLQPGCRSLAGTVAYYNHSYSGPRGIRTLDLLNAIETRSQLRYGPSLFNNAGIVTLKGLPVNKSDLVVARMPSGPGGIRTLDLFSAIEARSQLRYRPILCCVAGIVSERQVPVKDERRIATRQGQFRL